jgi:hypothetical protein
MKKYIKLLLVGAAVNAITATCASAFASNFSSEPGFAQDFLTPNGRPAVTWSSDPGVGGVAGRVNASASDGTVDTAAFYATAARSSFGSFSSGSSYSVSVFGLTGDGIGPTTAISIFGLGIGTAAETTVASGQTGWRMDVRHTTNASEGNPLVTMRLRNELGGSSPSVDSASFAILSNTWYEMRMDATALGGNVYSVTTSIFDWGLDGLTGGSLVESVSADLTNAGVGLSDLFAGFFVRNSNGFVAADNLMVVPEPGTYAFLFGLGAFGVVLLRRRSSAV